MYGPGLLPGVSFDAAPPPRPDQPPRMDIAVFVGFAANGPVHRPVAVDGVAAFEAVFGGDAPLGWDVTRGERVIAALAPTVRGFFANGGRRCWVIRVARTEDLEARWRGVAPSALGEPQKRDVARRGRFVLPGLVSATTGGTFEAAQAQARGLGAGSDGLRVSTRLNRTGLASQDLAWDDDGARFPAQGCRVGDLVELADPGFTHRAYAHVDSLVDGLAHASWRGRFARVDVADVGGLGAADLPGDDEVPGAASLAPAALARLTFTAPAPQGLRPGRWARWAHAGHQVWLRIDTARGAAAGGETVVEGPAWRALGPIAPAPGPVLLARLALDLRIESGASPTVLTEIGLTPDHPGAWWTHLDDDRFYARPRDAVSGRPPLSASDDDVLAPPTAWLPLGLEATFGDALGPLSMAGTALERDGLSRQDAELFLDPRLADLTVATLATEAERIREIDGERLFGVHGALGVGEGREWNEASLVAAPDAVQPRWERRPDEVVPPPTPAAFKPPPHWFSHRGACTTAPAGAQVEGPDFANFLDRDSFVVATPALQGPVGAIPPGPLSLTWTTADPAALYILEQATRADLSDAVEIWRGTALSHTLDADREGVFYYRLTARVGDTSSVPAAIAVAVRADAWLAAPFGEDAREALLSVHRALLRLAAASGELFAVLSLPRDDRAAQAVAHAGRLTARRDPSQPGDGLSDGERRALSYGALHHPWVLSSTPTRAADGKPRLAACPPDGVAAGVLAARANARGAWVAPANEPLRDIVGLDPLIDPADRLALDTARINLIRREPRGFLVLDADTLSDETEWRSIPTRRLFSLIRRLAVRRGASYVFEPNGDVLRRAVERGFSQMLETLFHKGAFAGATPAESFRVTVDPSPADRFAGRLLVEIAVAPAAPLRFLTVRLRQVGERFTFSEET
ncbi:hypothetical protein ASD79_08850 [Caulobacter sp. Root655]|uniref:phage tail sheath C-terminal domain-containing protein n=1 Tax=Caulobacter sp. Root655 TaxID=1736578 RepID=UPI0006F748E5|nr:phage tail sheath C-terminal domain-containing protein [Caulobacter sp. Root655]KRA60332.1 hypothetical protein ASD79_08850 [Caulobacter sp. Root655]